MFMCLYEFLAFNYVVYFLLVLLFIPMNTESNSGSERSDTEDRRQKTEDLERT